ncbi:MAG TPA: AMP-binding protein [Pseudonocardia sp.]|jgi:long-chain acyl-CoA synthetase|uniref:AMP-binding protein n=1 Tax=Pseudonocardia sp. TaxID=60912 RepID=UPI002EDB6841
MPNLVATLRSAARYHPKRIAIRSGTTAISFADLLAAAGRFGQRLSESGVTVGDRVALVMPNMPRYAVAYYGTLLAGGVAVPMNPAHSGSVLTARLRDTDARLLVVAHRPPATVPQAAKSAGVALCEFADAAEGSEEIAAAPVRDDAPALIAYKSTDVEEPTGVVLSHRALAWSATAAVGVLGLTSDDMLATHFPLFHPLGQTYGLAAAVAAGATLALPTVQPASALQVIESNEATVLSTFPTLIGALASDNAPAAALASLRTVFCSGGRNLGRRVSERLATRSDCEVLQGYGTVETSALGCAARSGEPPCPGSMGRAVPGVELAVVDGRGREAAAGKAGGLVVRGPNVMTGYWKRPRDTARAFSNDWLITGEKVSQDQGGNIYLLDNI